MPKTYTAHATMRNGLVRPVKVSAGDQAEAIRRVFAVIRATSSVSLPKVAA